MIADQAGMLEVLRELVEVETPSGDSESLRAGIEVLGRIVEERTGRTPHLGVSLEGIPHLYLAPRAEPAVLVIGHLDTVWPQGTLARMPFAVTDGIVTGPGVFDMKAGLTIALAAIAGTPVSDHVGLLVTCDEEVGSTIGRDLVERYCVDAAAVVIPEPAAPGGALKSARKGVAMYRFELRGRAAHAGLEPERGANSTVELATLVHDLIDLADVGAGTTVTPTVATSGSTVNTVPDRAELHADVRAWSSGELERVDSAVRSRTAAMPGVDVRVSGGINRPPLESTMSERVVELAERAAQEVGLGRLGSAAVGGGSDGNFCAALGVATLDGAGAVGGGAHADDEWVDLACLQPRAAWMARLFVHLVEAAGRDGSSEPATVDVV